ncbi:DDHD-domain-containing protein [Melanomma pulvis-pyrius CBS 109.77]|uniref:DDHD-domain-containing protein n=1 Tax=Melanomma pulvis-pyrius CBS 109.77 TaxID=1314802 RepID=A0A6A6X0J4_9PLEO|nr:DDHD-domain-containing protein [Melanomma pulvis-pyrius CBS 109.77]
MSTPENKPTFLSVGINALSPWGSRSSTPKPPPTPKTPKPEDEDKPQPPGMGPQRASDHTISRRHGLSLKKYPRDCPPLAVRWFHAVDVPKRKPFPSKLAPPPPDKPGPRPKKWIAFSSGDSRAIETSFQKLSDDADSAEQRKGIISPSSPGQGNRDSSQETSTKVPVNEDYLFDVEIETRELAPTYWLGPVYDVKRGTWFQQDGDPCDEHLATQLEEGFLKVKPWRFAKTAENRSASQPRTRPVSLNVKAGDDYRKVAFGQRDSTSNPVTPKSSFDNLRAEANKEQPDDKSTPEKPTTSASPDDASRTYRLFGAHMNSVVTYQDETTAWVLTDDFLSRMGGTLYQRFAGGAHYAGIKYVRGYVEPGKKKEAKTTKDDGKPEAADRPVTPSLAYGEDSERHPTTASSETASDDSEGAHSPSEARRKTLERHMSSLMTSEPEDSEKQEEAIRKRDEKEMREDYKDQSKDEQGREIEHLLLVTHGIGQRLGIRLESINFIHDVNTMRKSLKSVYANSPDLQALNSEVDTELKNSRVQVIPICWRHMLDFPMQSLKHNRKEHDLGDIDFDDHEYPNLEDITVEGVPAVRNLLTDLALDILLYQSPAYKGHISRIVLQECNRIYRLFKERNPSFKGKVSLVGHSLGSAIMFDLLCQQKVQQTKSHSQSGKRRRATEENLKLDFEVEDFYALGSPIGLFQMLKGRTIAGRPSNSYIPPETPASPLDDPFSQADSLFDVTVSSPLCKQLFNIFHPTDPISYRLEPLISPAMSTLKAQPLPYTKKGIFGGPTAQGLTGIGARVGQGVTDFWSSVSSGIASGLLNRSLGLSGTDAVNMRSDLTHGQRSSRPLSVGAGANVATGIAEEPARAFINEERKRRLGEEPIAPGVEGEHPPTLIDSEIETLYSGFQKGRQGGESEDGDRDVEKDLEWQELEERSRKLRKEEAKVRALNANGRVDYSIQEGAFDISLLASIASHLSYWADEDVSHFMISQLLARHRVFKNSNSSSKTTDDVEKQ